RPARRREQSLARERLQQLADRGQREPGLRGDVARRVRSTASAREVRHQDDSVVGESAQPDHRSCSICLDDKGLNRSCKYRTVSVLIDSRSRDAGNPLYSQKVSVPNPTREPSAGRPSRDQSSGGLWSSPGAQTREAPSWRSEIATSASARPKPATATPASCAASGPSAAPSWSGAARRCTRTKRWSGAGRGAA